MTDVQSPPDAPTDSPSDPNGKRGLRDRIDTTNAITLPLLAFISALVIGTIVIAFSDIDKLQDGDFGGILTTIKDAYLALPDGAFNGWRPINETIVSTTPLLLAGLAVAITFRAGLFNIGGTGQMLVGGMCSVYVGFSMNGPSIIQIPLAVGAGMLGGIIWGIIPGILKARAGVHEVISTIMLNFIAGSLVLYFLKTDLFVREGRSDPISKLVTPEGTLPKLFAFLDRPELRAHIGFLFALAAAFFFWWLIEKTKLGFEIRAEGANSNAAQYAGMKPAFLIITSFAVAGGFAGLAGASEVLGTQGRATQGFAGDIGFDAIAVALLGRSTPVGTVLAALLFGALQAGGQRMQVETGVPVDLVLILRALIILFIAAPLLMKAIWRISAKGASSGPSFGGWGS
ncbi:ABC transporter permease [Ilumatobacter nonamiensis]|uniref:ABC transporter permease n=1 Tax=Ilumatobacter nonamiensis TaxID=467093 RepID=UPI00034DAD8B|nr:ABC transporter permease [Ilumatobacter nonamiensis]